MDLRDYLKIFLKNWLVIALCLVLGAVAGFATYLFLPVKYTSSADLYVSVRTTGGDAASELLSGTNYARQSVVSYLDVVTSAFVLDRVISENDLPFTKSELEDMVSAQSPEGTVLITISAQDTDPERAALIANATSVVFEEVVEEQLESTEVEGQSRVEIQLIDPGEVPVDRDGWGPIGYIAVGLLAGLLLGMAAAVLRSILDTRIRSTEDVTEITDAPIIGSIPVDPNARKHPLVMTYAPSSPGAESVRKLRTNVEFLTAESEHRVFVVSSAVPGDGKSTVSANLAIAFAQSGVRVVVVDADLRKPKVAEYLGVPGEVGLTDVLVGKVPLADALQPWGKGGLSVLASGIQPPNPSELLGSRTMEKLIAQLREEFDFVIVDAPPLLVVTDAAVVGRFASGMILIARAGQTRRPELEGAVAAAKTGGNKLLGVVVTQLPTWGPDSYAYGHYLYGVSTTGERGAAEDELDEPLTAASARRHRRSADRTDADTDTTDASTASSADSVAEPASKSTS